MKKLINGYETDELEYRQSVEKLQKVTDQAVARQVKEYEKSKKRQEEQLTNLREDMEKLTLRAPIDGIFALGQQQNQRYMGNQQVEVKVGGQIRPNMVLGSIPDLSKFRVTANIPEAYRSQLKVGQVATLRSPAIPDLEMTGKLETIAPMAVPIVRWDQNSPKVYVTEFATETTDRRLMPGMTVEVEILVERVTDVLHVPVESLYRESKQLLCRVRVGSQLVAREVTAGRRSDHFVEIVDGLQEGEKVALQQQNISAQ